MLSPPRKVKVVQHWRGCRPMLRRQPTTEHLPSNAGDERRSRLVPEADLAGRRVHGRECSWNRDAAFDAISHPAAIK
jgi:hypothetical protein